MENLFLTFLNMSITASWVILAVLAVRLLLRRAPKKYSYALWSVVAFRLCCPLSFRSVFSLLGALQMTKASRAVQVVRVESHPQLQAAPVSGAMNTMAYIPQDIGFAARPEIELGSETLTEAVNASLPAATPAASINPIQMWIAIGVAVWCLGMVVLLGYSVVSWILLKRRLRTATRMEENVWQAEQICSPFILGMIRPKIYIPYRLDGGTLHYVLAHERFHISHGDHIVKPLAFVLLMLHWFNPLCWLAFFLMGKDMEMRCDEAVLEKHGEKKEYGTALLSVASNRRFPVTGPLAFGESGVSGRIRNILRWKHPKAWVTAAAVILCLAVLLACAANPAEKNEKEAAEETEAPAFDESREKLAVEAKNLLPGASSVYPDPIILPGDSELIYHINYVAMGLKVELGLLGEDGREYTVSVEGGTKFGSIPEIPAGTYRVFVRNSEENLKYEETSSEPLTVSGIMVFQYTGQQESNQPVEETAPEQKQEYDDFLRLTGAETESVSVSKAMMDEILGMDAPIADGWFEVNLTEEIRMGLEQILDGKPAVKTSEEAPMDMGAFIQGAGIRIGVYADGNVWASHPENCRLELTEDEMYAFYDLIRGSWNDSQPHAIMKASGYSDTVVEIVREAMEEQAEQKKSRVWADSLVTYQEFLDSLPGGSVYMPGYMNYYTLNVLDLDFNGVPELILYCNAVEDFPIISVCTIEEGEVRGFAGNKGSFAIEDCKYVLPFLGGCNMIQVLTEEIIANRWNEQYFGDELLQYLDTETGEIVYMLYSCRYVDDPPGYSDLDWETVEHTIYRFGSKDGYLQAKALHTWTTAANLTDWSIPMEVYSESDPAAYFSEWRERYLPVLGVDYGDQIYTLTIPEKELDESIIWTNYT